MPRTDPSSTSRTRMRAYRARLRAQGIRPVQVWLPDTGSRRFAAQARRQSRLIANDPLEHEILEFIEQSADLAAWKA